MEVPPRNGSASGSFVAEVTASGTLAGSGVAPPAAICTSMTLKRCLKDSLAGEYAMLMVPRLLSTATQGKNWFPAALSSTAGADQVVPFVLELMTTSLSGQVVPPRRATLQRSQTTYVSVPLLSVRCACFG